MELKEELLSVLHRQLAPTLRYRTLIFQCRHIPSLEAVQKCLLDSHDFWSIAPITLDHDLMFDSTGPLSSQALLTYITSAEYDRPVYLFGPLHICDCWTSEGRRVLWQHLAAFSAGPGIIVLDVPREADTQGLFRIAGRLTAIDACYLKSRLTATEDGLV